MFPLLLPVQGYSYVANQGQQAIAAKMDSSGTLDWATFFGTNSKGLQIATDSTGAAYVFGQSEAPLPITPGALESSAGVNPFFLAKIASSLGAPVPIVLFPSSLSFGSSLAGVPTSAQDVPVGNFGDVVLSPPAITITGDFAQTNTCGSAVTAGQKCDISVTFDPTATGIRTGTLTINFGGSFAVQTVSLTGTGIAPELSLTSNALVFPPQSVGTSSATMQVTISNPGSGALTISSLPITGDFTQTNACGAPIVPNGTCTVQVTFTPTAQGFRTGTLTINDNVPGSPQMVTLQGYVRELLRPAH